MIEILRKNNTIVIQESSKTVIEFDVSTGNILLDWYDVSYPWEYEKSWVLWEVKEYSWVLFYHFVVQAKHLIVVPSDSFELKEEILSFFGDVDILLITGTKDAAKVFENIEAKLVIPYGEGKDIFLNTLGQHTQEVDSYKVKWEFALDATEFVNLA